MKISYYQLDMKDDFAGWGDVTLFYEVDENGEVMTQIEIYSKGRALLYNESHSSDEYGSLADPMQDHEQYLGSFRISRKEFERVLHSIRPLNRDSKK